jgi:CBS domain-containing protein
LFRICFRFALAALVLCKAIQHSIFRPIAPGRSCPPFQPDAMLAAIVEIRHELRRPSFQCRLSVLDWFFLIVFRSTKGNSMQKIADVMTRDVMSVAPQETLRRAAQMMDEMNVGALPVCDGDRLVGMITDRDITVRATSAGENPEDTTVGEVMSAQVRWCFDDQTVDEVMQQMADTQIRRVPVIDHDTRQLIGIVSLGDLATKRSAEVDYTLEKISEPAQPNRPH